MATDNPAPSAVNAGRYNGRTPAQLATEAEEAIRGIVHLTEAEAPRAEPGELYRTLSALTRVVEQLPEAVTRIDAEFSSWAATGGLTVTAGPFHDDPDAAITALHESVADDVLPALGRLRTALVRAQAAVGEVTTR